MITLNARMESDDRKGALELESSDDVEEEEDITSPSITHPSPKDQNFKEIDI